MKEEKPSNPISDTYEVLFSPLLASAASQFGGTKVRVSGARFNEYIQVPWPPIQYTNVRESVAGIRTSAQARKHSANIRLLCYTGFVWNYHCHAFFPNHDYNNVFSSLKSLQHPSLSPKPVLYRWLISILVLLALLARCRVLVS